MSNPWDNIEISTPEKDVFDWLYAAPEIKEHARCTYCGATNTTEIYIERGYIYHLCNVCGLEFKVKADSERGLVTDIFLSDSAWVSTWEEKDFDYGRVRNIAEFMVEDKMLWRVSFGDALSAQIYIADVRVIFDALSASDIISCQGLDKEVVSVSEDYVMFSDNTSCARLRLAIGIHEGYFLLTKR